MKRSMNVLAAALGLLLLIVLRAVVALNVGALPGSPTPSSQPLQAASETPPLPGSPVATVTAAPTQPEPPETATAAAYPGPGETATPQVPTAAPTEAPAVLPPLPTFPPPGPFQYMRLMYTNSQLPGYRSIRADGTEEIMLAPWGPEPRSQFNAAGLLVAPDGSKVLYTYWNNMNQRQAAIWSMNPDGSEKQPLVAATDEWFPEDAIWSPDGTEIAYRRAFLAGSYDEGAPTRSRELWVMSADGGNQRRVLDDPALYDIDGAGGTSTVFRWLRNGYIYFVTHGRQLYAVNPASGQLYKLMENVDPLDIRTHLSPVGPYLVISPDLPAQTIEQAGLVPIAVPGGFKGWSVDGVSLIYEAYSDSGQSPGVWMHNLTTGQEHLLTPDEIPIIHGLSPDGQYLAYQTGAGLFVLEVASGANDLIVQDPHDPATGNEAVRFVSWLPVPQ